MAPLILRPTTVAHGGAAVARDEGKVWLVNYALPGELVEAEPRGRQGGVAVAATTRVVEASPHRVQAPCPYFGTCGGCQLQHASYTHQLEMKRQVVEEAWMRAGLRLPPDAIVLGMEDPWRYRIRGEFEATPEAEGWRFGFHRMRSHAVLPIDSCVIHDERIERALPAFARAADEMRLTGLQNLLVTVEPTGPGMLWRLRVNRKSRPREAYAQRVAELMPEVTLLDDAMTLEFWGLTFRVRSETFVQTNYRQMLILYRTALDMLQPKPGDRVLDLYAGIGTISVVVARDGAMVTAVEENPHAVLPIDSCVIHDERIERALPAFARAADEMRLTGLQNLLVTVEPTGPGMLWRLRINRKSWSREAYAQRVAELMPDVTLLDDAMTLEFWGLTFRVRSDTFVQTNYRQMLILYRTALDMLQPKPGERVLDLYAGIGTISVAVAREGAMVTAVEENPHAVRLGRLNARINSANVDYVQGKVEQALRDVRLGRHQAVVLDPPRAGCEPAAIAELIRLGIERLVYVSCEPSSHARDITALVRGGYRVRRAAIVDMFPQTYHIESVALLERS